MAELRLLAGELPRQMGRQFAVVTLTSPDDFWRLRARVVVSQEMIRRKAAVHSIQAEGKSPLAQLLWAVLLGDFVTVYLAFLYGVDPKEIKHIMQLKRRLAALKTPADLEKL